MTPQYKTKDPGTKNPMTILLIEDDRVTRRIVRRCLGEDYELLEANSANAGLSLFKETHPDIVLIDISLPDDDGHHLLEQILSVDPDTYGIMFSAHGDNNNVWQSIETGAKGYLTKPFDAEKMNFFIRKSRKNRT